MSYYYIYFLIWSQVIKHEAFELNFDIQIVSPKQIIEILNEDFVIILLKNVIIFSFSNAVLV